MKNLTNDQLLKMLSDELVKSGLYVYTDRRKIIEEMLRIRNVKF